MSGLFAPALAKMEEARVFGPVSFPEYLHANGLADKNTRQHISVDAVRCLAAELREARTMVFPLGSPTGEKNTHFALARYVTGWGD